MVHSLVLLLLLARIAGALSPGGSTRNEEPKPAPRTGGVPATCRVYQYLGVDSTARQLVLTRTYHPNGRVLEEQYRHYRLTHEYLARTGTEQSRYRDTMLVERLETDQRGDQIKTRYFHDHLNRLTREERLTLARRQKTNVDKGNGRPGGCILVDSDFRKRRSWEKTSVIHYAYDGQGQLVSYDAPTLHYSSQNRYTWVYDSLGRVGKHFSYDRQRLIWVEEFAYFPGGHRFTRTWYDADGSPSHLKPENKGYWPRYSTTYHDDENRQVTLEETSSEKGVLVSRTQWYYNAQHQLTKTVYQNGKGEVKLTHLFSYQ